jgi:hypothetical protein
VSLRLTSAAVAFVILLAGAGCMTESSNKSGNTPVTTANTNTTSATATTPEPAPVKDHAAKHSTSDFTCP